MTTVKGCCGSHWFPAWPKEVAFCGEGFGDLSEGGPLAGPPSCPHCLAGYMGPPYPKNKKPSRAARPLLRGAK